MRNSREWQAQMPRETGDACLKGKARFNIA